MKILLKSSLAVLSLVVVCWGAAAFGGPQAADPAFPVAKIHLDSEDFVWWEPIVEFESLTLTVSGPGDTYFRKEFEPGSTPFFEIQDREGYPISDGGYAYELSVTPVIDPDLKDLLVRARNEGREAEATKLIEDHRSSWGATFQSGSFRVHNAMFIVPRVNSITEISGPRGPGHVGDEGGDEGEDDGENEGDNEPPIDRDPGQRDQVILDDLIVDGSACIGFDCVNGESFGFDTLRLKENNLRIKFQDTSATASFPSNDWQLTANDSSNGGLNKFSIDDIDGARTPFTVEAGAPSHSLYVDDGGRIGLGTSTPVVDLHVVSGNTPTLRLEQNGSSGFTPQTWDVAGNEAGFFVRDATNGSTLPFRIRPGAPSSAIDVAASTGDVGIGSTSPNAALHVRRTTGSAQILVEELSSTATGRNLLELSNNGGVGIRYRNNGAGTTWTSGTSSANTFVINTGAVSTLEFVMDTGGNLEISGTLMQMSDENAKENFEAVDTGEVLDEILSLPIRTWSYKADPSSAKHLGPTAQDFHRAFGLGPDELHIAPADVGAASLAAIQELAKQLEDQRTQTQRLEDENKTLKQRLLQENRSLTTRLERVEALLAQQAAREE